MTCPWPRASSSAEANTGTPRPPASGRWGFRLALAGWGAVALAARLWQAGAPSLWHDEALEWQRAGLSWPLLLRGRGIDQDPPLMAILLKPWLALGQQEAWLRAPAALAGAALVVLLGAAAARRWGRDTGCAAAALAAMAPVLVHYGQELNQYSGMVVLAVVLWLAGEGVWRRGWPRDWQRLSGLSAVALTWHYGLAFPVAIQAAGLWRRGRSRTVSPPYPADPGPVVDRRALAGHFLVCATTVLLLAGLGLGERLATPHNQPRLFGTGVVKELDYLADHLWREALVFFLTPFGGGGALWVAGGLGMVALWGAILLWRGALDIPAAAGAGRHLVLLLGGNLALLYAADITGLYPLGNRWSLFLAPTLLLCLAAGLASLGRAAPALGRGALAATLLAFFLLWPQRDALNADLAVPREPLRAALAWLERERRPDEPLYLTHATAPAFAYYGRVPDLPPAHSPPAAAPGAATVVGLAPTDRPPTEDIAAFLSAARPLHRLWLIIDRAEPGQAAALAEGLLAAGWRQGRVWEQAGLRVEAWDAVVPLTKVRLVRPIGAMHVPRPSRGSAVAGYGRHR
ncbi:MAG: glycosyltransferase family 39 protein [Anaerolineae bacterium]